MFITFKNKRTNAVLNQAKYKVTGPRGYKKSGQGKQYGAGNLESGEYTLNANCPGYKSISSTLYDVPAYRKILVNAGKKGIGSARKGLIRRQSDKLTLKLAAR